MAFISQNKKSKQLFLRTKLIVHASNELNTNWKCKNIIDFTSIEIPGYPICIQEYNNEH